MVITSKHVGLIKEGCSVRKARGMKVQGGARGVYPPWVPWLQYTIEEPMLTRLMRLFSSVAPCAIIPLSASVSKKAQH